MSIVHMQKQNIAEMLLKRLLKNKKMEVIKFLGENPGTFN